MSTTSRDSALALLGGSPTISLDEYRRWPDIRPEDRAAVMAVLDRGILTGGGAVDAPGFGRDYAEYVGVRHCLPFNAGTAALHACAVAAGLEPGDEAIVPAFTYVASAMSMAHHGVRPVFADVELDTYLLDVAAVEDRITERTRAIVAVHLHGLPCDITALKDVADRHGLGLIEDISQAHGARFKGEVVGALGTCAGGSLNATKNLPGGEGGMFLTDDDEAAVIARRLRYMGEDPLDEDPPLGRRYWAHGLGWNYRPQELPFAFARSQLKRLDGYNGVAQRNAQLLTETLAPISGIVAPRVPQDREHVWYIYRVRLDPAELGFAGPAPELRDRVVAALAAEGVQVSLWQHDPLPAFSAFRRPELRPWVPNDKGELRPWDPDEYPVASRICNETFVIGTGTYPLACQPAKVMERICEALQKVMSNLEALLELPFESPAQTRDAIRLAETRGAEGTPPTVED
jgi:perosamine synthetase